MTRATFTVAVAFLCGAAASPVTFESPCSCHDNHGEHRWAVKNDPSTPPTDASAIQAVTPSDVFSWSGPAEHLTQRDARKHATSTGKPIAIATYSPILLNIFIVASRCPNESACALQAKSPSRDIGGQW